MSKRFQGFGIGVTLVSSIVAGSSAKAQCPADWDGNGTVEVADLFAFLNNWFAGNGDYDRNRVVEVADIYAFQHDWFGHSPSCGQGLSSSRDPFFYQQFVQPSLATISAVSGVHTYPGDIVVLRPNPSSGAFDVMLWNRDIQGISGVVGTASNIQVFHDGAAAQMTFADATATASHRTMAFQVTGGLGASAYVCGVGVEAISSCGNPDAADIWAVVPMAVASGAGTAAQLCQSTRPDYAVAMPASSTRPLCAMVASGSDAGALGDIAQQATTLGCSGFESAVVRAMIDPHAAAAAMGIGPWSEGDSGLFLPAYAAGAQPLNLTTSTSAATIGTATQVSTVVVDGPSTVPTGYVVPSSGHVETLTVTPTISVLSVNLNNGYSGFAVVFGANVSASTAPQCPIVCGAVSAVFSSQATANAYVERVASAGLSPASAAATAVILTGDLPPGYEFPPGYIYPNTPPNLYPTIDLPTGPEGMPGHWDKNTIACFAKFNDDLRAADAKRNNAHSQCSYWDLSNIGGGATVCGISGGGIGIAIGVWGCGVGAIPGGTIGGIIGGCIGIPVGSIGGYQLCIAKADRAYDCDRDAAIREYLNCICKYGYCVPGVR